MNNYDLALYIGIAFYVLIFFLFIKNEMNKSQLDREKWLIDELSIWIRGNFFIPDARSLWIKPSVRFLSKYLKNNPVDAILTDGPPHTNTVIGCKLATP